MKKLISTLLVILMLVSPLSMAAYAGVGDLEFDENEPNDYFDDTNILYSDYTVYGYLDGEYAAFGRVIEGMDVVDSIATSGM